MDLFRAEPPPSPDMPQYKLVHRSRLHEPMLIKLKSHFGVHVHWSVYHSGNSTSSRVLANEMWKIGRGVKFVRARCDLTKHSFKFVSITST
jgi:hypothetical protein